MIQDFSGSPLCDLQQQPLVDFNQYFRGELAEDFSIPFLHSSLHTSPAMEEQSAERERLCPVCKTASNLTCKGCQLVVYCSTEHQRQDWKSHKEVCQAYGIRDVGEFPLPEDLWLPSSQYCVATRNVNVGELILEEAPLLVLPWFSQPTETHQWIPCLTCGMSIRAFYHRIPEDKRCTNCKWPVCSRKCETHPLHSLNECKEFVAKRIPFPPKEGIWEKKEMDSFQNPALIQRMIAIQNRDPAFVRQLLELPLWKPTNASGIDNIKGDTADDYSNPPNIPEEEHSAWMNFREVVRNQGFLFDILEENVDERNRTLKYETIQTTPRTAYNVYKRAGAIAHSCSPNCDWIVSYFPSFKIRITASVPITKGDILFLDRLLNCKGGYPPARDIRRQMFGYRFGFVCECKLCSDPTEMGTYESAVGCPECRRRPKSEKDKGKKSKKKEERKLGVDEGYLLPLVPKIFRSLWKCNHCGLEVSSRNFYFSLQEIQARIHEDARRIRNTIPSRLAGIAQAKALVAQFEGTMFHPNHWLITKALMAPMESAKVDLPGQIPFHRIEFVYSLACHNRYLAIWEKKDPGMSNRKASMLRAMLMSMDILSRDPSDFLEMIPYMNRAVNKEELLEDMVSNLELYVRASGFLHRLVLYYKTTIPSPQKPFADYLPVLKRAHEIHRARELRMEHCTRTAHKISGLKFDETLVLPA